MEDNGIEELKKEIVQIKERNKRVETNKAWETSWVRRICIMILTYITDYFQDVALGIFQHTSLFPFTFFELLPDARTAYINENIDAANTVETISI